MSTLRERYFEQLKANFDKGLRVMGGKNEDYARETDPFNNFRDSAKFAEVTLEQGILVRTFDKLTRYRNLLRAGSRTGAVGESIEDNLMDIINYMNILKTWHDLGEPAPDGAVQLPLNFDTDISGLAEAYYANVEDLEADVTDYEIPPEYPPQNSPTWIQKLISKVTTGE